MCPWLRARPRNTDDYVDLWARYLGNLDAGLFRTGVPSALSGTRQSGMFMTSRNTIRAMAACTSGVSAQVWP